MSVLSLLSIAAPAMACLCASFAASWALSRKPARPATAVLAEEGVRSGAVAHLMRNGVSFLLPVSRLFLRVGKLSALVQEGVALCASKGMPTTAEALASAACGVLGVASLAAGVFTGSAVAAIAVPLSIALLANMALRGARDARREAVRDTVPEVLRSLEACFQAGYTLMQAFDQTARETKGPLRMAFLRATRLLEAGRPVPEALAALRETAAVPELSFVAVALEVQHEAGGGMKRVLDAARDTVEGEIELKRSLRVQTAQAKLSARIVSVMPVVLIALFSLVSEGFLEPFFASPAGWALLALALSMQVAGVLAVRRVLSVEVSL